MSDKDLDETITGIFAVAELLYDQRSLNEDSRLRIQSTIHLLPPKKQKYFAILQLRAEQLAAEMLKQFIAIDEAGSQAAS